MSNKIPIDSFTKGFLNTYLNEQLKEPKVLSGENWIQSENNSYIRLGRDRYGGPSEGYGSLAQGNCGAIDLFVGAAANRFGTPEDKKKSLMNPNFLADAGRIYISQRCDIDTYFGITSGTEMTPPEGRSGIGLKADQIRVFAGQHLKLVTGKAAGNGFGSQGAPNNLGGPSDGGGRIEFIVGNNTQPVLEGPFTVPVLQPVPLGNNLEKLLKEIISLISSLRSIVSNNTSHIQEVAQALMGHYHTDTPQPLPGISLPSPNIIARMMPLLGKSISQDTIGIELQKFNKKITNLNHLDPEGAQYILSSGVYTT
jgi:hypothetical protein